MRNRRRAVRRVGRRARPKKRRIVVMAGQVLAPVYVCMMGRWSVSWVVEEMQLRMEEMSWFWKVQRTYWVIL